MAQGKTTSRWRRRGSGAATSQLTFTVQTGGDGHSEMYFTCLFGEEPIENIFEILEALSQKLEDD